jgi:uncharacterized protein (DUF779 family)
VTPRVVATDAALQAIRVEQAERGPLMFVQSAGCCDGSLPMCFELGELEVGDHDVLLGEPGQCPFYIEDRLLERWGHVQLILDVSPGEPEGFSLPAGRDHHFVTRSRVLPRDEPLEPALARSTKEGDLR